MFATLSRFRRQIAVLTALAMLASVLVAVPIAADEHPEQDYTATYDACVGVGSSGFEDVPSGHANAGDIDCIAYYGITKGTSTTTYSPLRLVSREEMALFLTRLAARVGIELASDPDDAGFTDIGDLSDGSQTAINQLADLGIAKGKTTTTFSPGDSVRRDNMALFIARLMNEMEPMAEDDDNVFGHTPEGVVDVDDADDSLDKTVGSPFTDLGSTTKTAYDAITALWELGVASGISDTAYAPSASITRASMAEFMAGVLDHSNARPAGVTIQSSETGGFGLVEGKIAVSYRDDSFAPMVDVSIKTFHNNNDGAEDGVGEFDEDGNCMEPTDCAWTDDEMLTDDSGNIFFDGSAPDGKTNTYYAWMGDADEDENDFNVNSSTHASVTLSSTTDATALKVTTDINANSTDSTDTAGAPGNTVDIDSGASVTHTVQLIDGLGDPVAKSGVEISVSWAQTTDGATVTVYPPPAPLETDADGKATFTSSGPESTEGNTDAGRVDVVTFSADVDETPGLNTDPTSGDTEASTVNWIDLDPVMSSGKGSAPAYALYAGGEVTIRASVTFYDQYGNTAGKGFLVNIGIGDADDETRTVSSRGVASWRATLEIADAALDTDVSITYDTIMGLPDDQGTRTEVTGVTVEGGASVEVVEHADDDSTLDATEDNVDAVYADENRFLIGNDLYTYDSNDIFIDSTETGDGAMVDMDKFESLIGANLDTIAETEQASVQIVSYDDDGSSIFRVVTPAGP